MAKQPMGDVVVLLPGILGSVLARDGKEVWAPTPGAIGRALWTLGRSVRSLELTADPIDVDDIDGVTATRLMPDVHIVPGLWGIDGYRSISQMITDRFEVVAGRTYIEFPYDWRRDNRVAANRLRVVVDEKLHAQRRVNPDAKLILIGHSMGGLVARYFLECLDGWRDTRALITFGTPHRGSLNAVDFLVNGFVKKIGPLKLADLSALLRSLTSVYQLLPVYPCVDAGSGHYVRPADLDGGLPGVDDARAESALTDFHRAIEAGVARREPGAYALHSIVGITQGTKQSARWDGARLEVLEDHGGTDMMGDGTVPRVSATPIETEDWPGGYQPMYSSDRHASLQNADPVRTQLLGILTDRPSMEFRDDRGVRLDADEALEVGEPLTVEALPGRANLDLALTVTDLATGRVVVDRVAMRRDADEVHHAEVAPLPEGDYRVTVAGVGDSAALADPVHGLTIVLPDEPVE